MAQIPMSPQTLDAYQQHDPAFGPDHPSAIALIHGSLFEGEVLDGLYRGCGDGMSMLGVTSRRLIMVETKTHDRLALTSLPLGRVTSVSLMCQPGESLEAATLVAIKVTTATFELCCRDRTEAREAHDLVVWSLING